MRAFLALFVGCLCLVSGYCVTAVTTYWLAGLAGMSDFEGGRGMFAGLFAGPIGAFIFCVAGIVLGWYLGRRRLTPNSLMLVFLLVALAIGSVLGVWYGG
ncbi:MAG: hypothetical protein P4L98_18520 [Ancalomicrobiaceae bacterium]|nr:hypothetical protein [Ancalomicrobiaceae bacterium]